MARKGHTAAIYKFSFVSEQSIGQRKIYRKIKIHQNIHQKIRQKFHQIA